MTVREVSEATGISRGTVYANLQSGKLKAIKHGNQYYITTSDCLKWANTMWKQGRALMYDPDRAERFIADFKIDCPNGN